MAVIESKITIQAERKDVFTAFTNRDLEQKWKEGLESSNQVKGEPWEIGSKRELIFLDKGRKIKFEETVTGFTEDEILSYVLEHPGVDNNTTIKFAQLESGTQVTVVNKSFGRAISWRLMMGFMKKHLKARQDSDLNNLKQLLEDHGG